MKNQQVMFCLGWSLLSHYGIWYDEKVKSLSHKKTYQNNILKISFFK